MPPAAL